MMAGKSERATVTKVKHVHLCGAPCAFWGQPMTTLLCIEGDVRGCHTVSRHSDTHKEFARQPIRTQLCVEGVM